MSTGQKPDLLETDSSHIDLVAINQIRNSRNEDVSLSRFKDTATLIDSLPSVDELSGDVQTCFSNDVVKIGSRDVINDQQLRQIEAVIQGLCPWRKGPFELFGRSIDAEWRSNLKWDRIVDSLGELRGRKVVDVGCGNGYYMFRAADQKPEMMIGVDPSVQFALTFELLQKYANVPSLQFERLGAEHMSLFDRVFDVGMCMGVVYHRKSPIEVLQSLRHSVRVGGHVIVESQTVPGAGTTALFPKDRYAKARNVFFVPTKDCLANWVKRAGFKEVEIVSHTKVTVDEQRRTDLMTFESLADFLDPDDVQKTIEGYPAPWRTVVRGVRKFLN